MSSNNSSVAHPWVPSPPVATLDEELRNSGAPVLTTALDDRLLNYDEPFSAAELAAYRARLGDFYRDPELAPTTTLGQGRPRERRLAPAPTAAPTPAPTQATCPAAIGQERRSGQSGTQGRVEKRVLNKVKQACKLCRKAKTKCDGGKPQCKRCASRSDRECVYGPTQLQIEGSRKKAAKKAARKADATLDLAFVEPPRPVETAPAENRNLWRTLLPYPEQGAALGRLTEGQARHAEEGFDEGFDLEFGGNFPEDADLSFGGNEGLHYAGLPALAFGGSNARPREFVQGSQEPGWAVAGPETRQNEFFQNPQELDWAPANFITWQNVPSPSQLIQLLPVFPEPGFAYGGAVPPPNETLTHTRNTSFSSDGPGVLLRSYEPGMGYEFNNLPQTRPDNWQTQIGGYHHDETEALRDHFAELDAMAAPGYGRR